jgi:site-specific recombinase XerD
MSQGVSEALLARFEEHLVLSNLSPLTVVNYVADLRACLRWGADRAVSDFSLATLSSDTIRAYRSHLLEEKNCATATVNRRLQAIRKFCAFAVQAGLMTSNPAEGIRLVKSEGNVPNTMLTGEQIRVLLQNSGSEQPSLARRDRAILLLLLNTGLRVNELVSLHLDDVQFDHPGTHLIVRDGRGGGTRQIPIDGDVRHALYEYLSVRPNVDGESHLFLSREGRPLSGRSVQRIVSARARAAGLEGVSSQALRRTYANRLLASTGDLALVAERLGHQNLTTTTRYIGEIRNSVEEGR